MLIQQDSDEPCHGRSGGASRPETGLDAAGEEFSVILWGQPAKTSIKSQDVSCATEADLGLDPPEPPLSETSAPTYLWVV